MRTAGRRRRARQQPHDGFGIAGGPVTGHGADEKPPVLRLLQEETAAGHGRHHTVQPTPREIAPEIASVYLATWISAVGLRSFCSRSDTHRFKCMRLATETSQLRRIAVARNGARAGRKSSAGFAVRGISRAKGGRGLPPPVR